MPIDEKFRPFMEEMRMLDSDRDGREKLVGLTFEESEWYLAYLDDRFPTDRDEVDRSRDDSARYLELNGKHERHRMAILMAENEAKLNPIRN
jgi:hypothetical protein